MSRTDHRSIERVDLLDPIWHSIRDEAEQAVAGDQVLGGFLYATILNHDHLEDAVAHRIAERLDHSDLSADLLRQSFTQMWESEPSWSHAIRIDIQAYLDRDPACDRFLMPVLYFKGFHAVQTHRLAHWLWRNGRKDFALYLQSRSSSVFQTDIHPAAKLGKGLFLDHATGLVVGETAVVEDNVSILHDVTLGGTGKNAGVRHPTIRHGVLIGAGAKILGNIEVGHCVKIAAGSVVLQTIPHNKTVAGVPACIVGESDCAEEPSREMDHRIPNDPNKSGDFVI